MNNYSIAYTLDVTEAHTHYITVEMCINAPQHYSVQGAIELKMAAWTPGSYLIREYARFVEMQEIYILHQGENKALAYRKCDKHTWRVRVGEEVGEALVIRYKVYAFDLTVRTNYADQFHIALQGAPTFLYIAGHLNLPAKVVWRDEADRSADYKVLTALPTLPAEGADKVFFAKDYHTLVDSPIVAGAYDVFEFEACGVRHVSGVYGLGEYNQESLAEDMQKVVESATAIMGENPCTDYLFLTVFMQYGRGGLEHLDSTMLIAPREDYFKYDGYEDYLTLVAHEYFHLWNVKRLCPKPLDNFNYEAENYTTLLWQAEGFTSYYENIIMLKAGLISPEVFLKKNLEHLDIVENQEGNKYSSVAEASFNTWIGLYRPHENLPNMSISYYTKGAIVAMLLDIEIMRRTDGARNLDDLMRAMYQKYYKIEKRGFTEEEILEEVMAIIASPATDEVRADMVAFFDSYIYGTAAIDYKAYLEVLGIDLIEIYANMNVPSMEWALDKQVVKIVKRDGAAAKAGISAGDQIVSLAGFDAAQYVSWAAHQTIGKEVSIMFMRDGVLRETIATLAKENTKKFKAKLTASPTSLQSRLYEKWINR